MTQGDDKRAWRPWWLLVLFLAALLLAGKAAVPYYHGVRGELWLRDFQRTGSPQAAERLVRLLNRGDLSREFGEDVLGCLVRPDVLTRGSYEAGRPVYIGLRPPAATPFRDLHLDIRESVRFHSRELDYRALGGDLAAGERRLLILPPESIAPSDADGEIVLHCTLYRADEDTDLAHRGQALYMSRVSLPLKVSVARGELSDFVRADADAGLGGRIRSALVSTPVPQAQRNLPTADGQRQVTGGIRLTYKDFPADAAFRVLFAEKDGPQHRLSTDPLKGVCLRKGASGEVLLPVAMEGLSAPGRYDGTLILTSCREVAYTDPEIASIWEGTLEFPATLEVKTPAAPGK